MRAKFVPKLLVFLLAGAIINVAVAWGCALSNGRSRWPPHWNPNEYLRVWIEHDGDPNAKRIATSRIQRFGYDAHFALFEKPVSVRSVQTIDCLVYRAGWPCITFDGVSIQQRSNGPVDRRDYWVKADQTTWLTLPITMQVEAMMRNGVPFRPIFPGFAINTIFYAAALWMLFALPGTVRRRVRIKRGQCAACGYLLRGSAGNVCPECGATTIKHKAETQKA